MTTAIKSVSVSLEFVKLAEEFHISMSEACRVGISVMLAEMGETKFFNDLNIGRKVKQLSLIVNDLSSKLEAKNVLEKI